MLNTAKFDSIKSFLKNKKEKFSADKSLLE
jgi:hypothetical protein